MIGKGLALGFALLLAGLACIAQAQSPFSSFPPGVFSNKAAIDPAAGGGCTPGTNASNFIARRSGTADPSSAFCVLINFLDTNSLFAKFDWLHVYATDTSGNGLLSLISATYNGTIVGSPTFTANSGFTGTDGVAINYIDSNFPPSTASSPKCVQDSCMIFVWPLTNVAAIVGGAAIGNSLTGHALRIFPKYSDGNYYSDANSSSNSTGFTQTSSIGMFLVNRSTSNAVQHYYNGSSLGSSAETSATFNSGNIFTLAMNSGGVSPVFGSALQVSVAGMGSSMSAGDVTNLNSGICTYLTTIHGSC